MSIHTEREGSTLIAIADERVDGANAREFQNELEAAIDENDHAVILDLQRLFYISSAGLRVILLTAKAWADGKRNWWYAPFRNRCEKFLRSVASIK